MATPDHVELLDLIDDITRLERTTAAAELVAQAARQRGLLPEEETSAEPPWFGIHEQVQALASDGLVDVVVEPVPHTPGDPAFPGERVHVIVTDAGREALAGPS